MAERAADVARVLGTRGEDVRGVSVARWLRDRELGDGITCDLAQRQGVEVFRGPISNWPTRVKRKVYAEAIDECMTERGGRARADYYVEAACRVPSGTTCLKFETGLGRFCVVKAMSGVRSVLRLRERTPLVERCGTALARSVLKAQRLRRERTPVSRETATTRSALKAQRSRAELDGRLYEMRSYKGMPFDYLWHRISMDFTVESARTCATCDRRACKCRDG